MILIKYNPLSDFIVNINRRGHFQASIIQNFLKKQLGYQVIAKPATA